MHDSPPLLTPVAALPGHPRLATSPLVVLALCADWCGTCRDFQQMLDRLARARPEIVFAWADIEDDAELVGDIDVESFPTLAVFRAGQALHYGVSLPQEGLVARTIDTLAARPPQPARDMPDAVAALAHWIAGGPGR
ncbi:MAG: thioredoxin family protein [Thauera sp.]|nr:thioredoxin family protein [Thauera sp.]